MVDIATLGVEVYTSSVRSGTRDLNALADASIRAEDSAESLRVATSSADQTQQRANSTIVAGALALGENLNASIAMTRAELALAQAVAGRAAAEARALAATGTATEAELDAVQARVALSRQRVATLRQEVSELNALSKTAAAGSMNIRREEEEMEALRAQAAHLRSVIDPLGTAQARYNQEMAEYNQLAARGVITARELGQAQALATQRLHNYNAVMNGGMETTAGGRQANLSNVVAQFQDIAVTASAGMNPLTIALQQGSQLSQAFLLMENPIKTMGQALLSLLSPISLVTLGGVALAAVLLQMVDWGDALTSVMYMVADSLVAVSPYVVGLAATLALIYAPAILGGIASLIGMIFKLGATAVVAGAQMLGAWMVAVGPVGVLIAGVAAVVAAMVIFRDEVTKIFGRDIVEDIKNSANYVIGAFVGAFNAIVRMWGQMPQVLGDIVYSSVNGVIAGVESMLNAVSDTINGWKNSLGLGDIGIGDFGKIDLPEVENPYSGAMSTAFGVLQEEVLKAQEIDWVTAGIDGVRNVAGMAAEALRGLADSFAATGESSKKADKGIKQMLSDVAPLLKENLDPMQQLQRDMDILGALLNARAIDWEQYGEAARRAHLIAASSTLGAVGQISGALTQLFKDNKAVAIANALINTAEGVTKALSQGGVLGFVGAAAVATAGAAQIASIMSTQPGSSGSSPSVPSTSGTGSSSVSGSSAPARSVSFNIQGDTIPVSSFKRLIDQLNDELGVDGLELVVNHKQA